MTDSKRRIIAEMMAEGTFGWVMLATKDLYGASAGNLVRIQELR